MAWSISNIYLHNKEKSDCMEKNIKILSAEPASAKPSTPPSRLKITEALKVLLRDKDFNSITTAEISRMAHVNEALIYRYFIDKRGLLHAVLSDYLQEFVANLTFDLKGIHGAINKIQKFVWASIHYYDDDRVFSKIQLLEVRNFPGYFDSETYQMVRKYAGLLMEIIEEGIESGDIRNDIAPSSIRQLILGAIEHCCLPAIIFDHKIDNDAMADNLCEILFHGITRKI
ncbi:MAG: TetR family transcriptional regulator [Desulfobacterales bacterium CG23_combo_of_CG06-09_8_20_14_all_51_8]|nr:MAG: TetR family transcriptional regulator [Desulfobacterales bacterium CG23_combo_of_CG06-09_8_20_14_all_51_8]